MQSNLAVDAIVLSDIHLSHKAPLARAIETDWYSRMQAYCAEVSHLAMKHEAFVFCTGDIFHKWQCPPELITFAIKHLPKMYAVPGQHDLPHHEYFQQHRSAYGALTAAGNIINLSPWNFATFRTPRGKDLHVMGMPWGTRFNEFKTTDVQVMSASDNAITIAICHHYIWAGGHSHPGAIEDDRYDVLQKKLKGFDIAFFGDNHNGFRVASGHPSLPTIVNVGTFMRRRADEVDRVPRIMLLMSDGSTQWHKLESAADDKWYDPSSVFDKLDSLIEMDDVLEELRHGVDSQDDFKKAVLAYAKGKKDIRSLLVDLFEEIENDKTRI